MGLVKRKSPSPKQIAANRRNALTSTGPRSAKGKQRVGLNAFKHGLYAASDARSQKAVMTQLGEDPREYERLYEALMEAWQPENAMQAMLVKDLADLYWQKGRVRRARESAQLLELEKVEREREEQSALR